MHIFHLIESLAQMKVIFLLFLLCFTFSVSSSTIEEITDQKCGTIYDGLTEGKFDIQQQFSTTTFGANWFGFGEDVLSYEWAIFSDSQVPSNTMTRCVRQLRVIPDIQTWKNVQKANHGINTNLQLQEGRSYFSAVRATLRSGLQLITFSDGFQVINEENHRNLFVTHQENKTQNEERNILQEPLSCSIDDFNRCRSSQISVSDRLNELYGEARFPFDLSQDIVVFEGGVVDDDDDNNDDDDGGNYVWVLAPVLGVVLLALCLLLLLLLLLFICCKGVSLPEREHKPKAAPMEFDEVEESKGYGMRDGVETVDTGTDTSVVFPDMAIRRLSISHDNNEAVAAEDNSPRRGRAPHPIMTSASSSFRDFRNT